MNDKGSTSSGVGFCGLLAILFIALKLCGVIKWSWLWVLSPLWIPLAIFLISSIIYIIVMLLKLKVRRLRRKKNEYKKD